MPHPNDPRHAQLEQDIRVLLGDLGFVFGTTTYHETMSEELVERLKRLNDPTATYIRTKADGVAIHPKYPVCMEWEAKTKPPKRNNPKLGNGLDMTTEVYPLAVHAVNGQLGVNCLYAYRDSYQEIDCGFWSDEIPPIREIHIPTRSLWVTEYVQQVFPTSNYQYKFTQGNDGSEDAYAIIDVSEIKKLPHWESVLRDRARLIAEGSNPHSSKQVNVPKSAQVDLFSRLHRLKMLAQDAETQGLIEEIKNHVYPNSDWLADAGLENTNKNGQRVLTD